MTRLATAFAVLSLLMVLAPGAMAHPHDGTGCPAGYETITLEDAAAEGYVTTPENVDSGQVPGEPGNGDGVVCRVPAGKDPNFPYQLYIWQDNDVRGHGG